MHGEASAVRRAEDQEVNLVFNNACGSRNSKAHLGQGSGYINNTLAWFTAGWAKHHASDSVEHITPLGFRSEPMTRGDAVCLGLHLSMAGMALRVQGKRSFR